MIASNNLCSIDELSDQIENDEKLKILDSSWYLPSEGIDTQSEYAKQHIPSAAFFHIDSICDQQSDLPHMLPSADDFAAAVGQLGVSNDSNIVVYDSAGLFSAARVWWMFKVFGHDSVRVLNGGLPAWIESGGMLSNKPEVAPTASYKATLNATMVANKTDLIENCSTHAHLVLDARPTPRFLGQAPEPRPGLPSGHMPQSKSLPVSQIVENGYLKTAEQLRNIFSSINVDATESIITSCGSGVTAAIITLALAEAGYGMHSLYDGSWAEWGSSNDTKILTC